MVSLGRKLHGVFFLQLPANRRQNKNVCDICYSSITLQPFLVSREVCVETHYTATHVTSISVFNINLEVLHVFPVLVPSLLDAVGHCIVHACYEEFCFTNHSADAKGF